MTTYSVFIGRFQPFHRGHLHVVSEALSKTDKLIICIGSADEPRSERNPFTAEERRDMILFSTAGKDHKRLIFEPIVDTVYNNDKWVNNVVKAVHKNVSLKDRGNISLVGYAKDYSSFYLKLFPMWNSLSIDPILVDGKVINSTDLRNFYFSSTNPILYTRAIPVGTNEVLSVFMKSDEYINLTRDIEFSRKYRKQYENYPYPPTFNTVDSLVVQSGHVLLVERKASPGLGQFALPGGYLQQNETLIDGAIRELREETKLKVPAPVLLGSLKDSRTFDAPNRSSRGRVITTCFHFSLRPDRQLPKVVGSDDAKRAFWMPFSDIKRSNMFEDHYSIIEEMI